MRLAILAPAFWWPSSRAGLPAAYRPVDPSDNGKGGGVPSSMGRPLTSHEQQILRERSESLGRMREEHGRQLRALEKLVRTDAVDPESLLCAIPPSPVPDPAMVAGALHAVVAVLTGAPFGGTWQLDEDPDSTTFLRPVVRYENGARHDPAALAFAIVLGEAPWEQLRPVLAGESGQ